MALVQLLCLKVGTFSNHPHISLVLLLLENMRLPILLLDLLSITLFNPNYFCSLSLSLSFFSPAHSQKGEVLLIAKREKKERRRKEEEGEREREIGLEEPIRRRKKEREKKKSS